MSAIQLAFTLRTSSNVKTVHLLGSWDNYKGQLPLSKDAAKAGGWKGTFRFQGSTLQAGQRYWYYYIMDGYHVSHDPAQPFTKEPTTGRSLNILDVPRSGSGPTHAAPLSISKRGEYRQSAEIPKGRSLSPSKIAHPKPSKPYASRRVREADYSTAPGVDEITSHLEQASLYGYSSASPPSSVGSSLSSRSSGGGSSPSSLSSLSDQSASSCRCNRFGITRKGDRVKMDCGGNVCGYSDDSSSGCSSESEDEKPNHRPKVREVRPRAAATSTNAGYRRR
ncbi:hypothetical protein MMC19_005620 [Ptychographa xylographoides]|nr:hypothetical protein [Ptychographa xylographoides]